MVRSIFRHLTILVFSLFMGQVWAVNNLTASVDRNPVMERESFILQIEADDSVSSDELDLSPLDNLGLVVGRTSTSSQTQVVNGKMSQTTTWSVLLVARTAGKYVIPALTLRGAKTQPITIEVIKSSPQQAGSGQPIFIKNNIERKELYIQQSTKLVTRLYFSPQVELQSGTLSEPELAGAFVQQQGKDKETSEIIMGVRYRVIERIYTVTPQNSGEFVITSPTFNGEVATGNRRRLFSINQTKPVSAFGADLKITVLPIPDNYQGTWLASDIVQLNEEWQPEKDTFEVGEAITRTFTLMALNVNEEQLPEVSGSYPSAFKVYPDQTESHSVLRQNGLVAQRISSEAIVANKPGTYTLPEVSVSWFNTKIKRQEQAIVPARTVTIVAAQEQANNPAITNLAPQQNVQVQECPVLTPCETSSETPWYQALWFTISGWILFVITAVLAFFSRNSDTRKPANNTVKHERKFDLSTLKRACQKNDASSARAELVSWGQQYYTIANLNELEPLVSAQLQREIRRLNMSQYSATPTQWQGENLWKLIQHETDRNKQQGKHQGDLPELN